jgi:spore germination cell wall hydrolase CwlJ-like protein
MLARLVYLEANTESLECQRAVASVVINRWLDGRWGSTIASVIYSPYQFSPAGLIHKTTPTETNYVAVDHVLKNGSILPKYCLFFRSQYGFSSTWSGYVEYAQIDNMYFGYFTADKN